MYCHCLLSLAFYIWSGIKSFSSTLKKSPTSVYSFLPPGGYHLSLDFSTFCQDCFSHFLSLCHSVLSLYIKVIIVILSSVSRSQRMSLFCSKLSMASRLTQSKIQNFQYNLWGLTWSVQAAPIKYHWLDGLTPGVYFSQFWEMGSPGLRSNCQKMCLLAGSPFLSSCCVLSWRTERLCFISFSYKDTNAIIRAPPPNTITLGVGILIY
jgi:hypothetical protein